MEYQVANGVKLRTIHTTKFKNTKILINLTFPAHSQNYGKLAMLAELLQNCSAKYHSELLVSRQLSRMYGASYGVTVLRYGNQHTLQIKISFPNDKYLPSKERLMTEILEFLEEMIEKPYISGVGFNQAYFEIHQNNLVNYLNSIADNKEYYAVLKLQKLYYPNDPDHGNFLLGSGREISELDSKSLYSFYQQVMKTSAITILVAGEIDDQEVLRGVEHFRYFVDRPVTKYELRVMPQPVESLQSASEKIDGSQSILNVGYELPVYFGDEEYFPAVIFNQLFGSSTRSLLFTNVREKASLAYDIHSSYNSLAGIVTVQAGIDYQNEQQVLELIPAQITKLLHGDYSDQLMDGVKQSMINQHRSEADHLSAVIEKRYIQQIMNIDYPDTVWEERINSVTKDDIKKIAAKVKLRAIFALNSQGANNENNSLS